MDPFDCALKKVFDEVFIDLGCTEDDFLDKLESATLSTEEVKACLETSCSKKSVTIVFPEHLIPEESRTYHDIENVSDFLKKIWAFYGEALTSDQVKIIEKLDPNNQAIDADDPIRYDSLLSGWSIRDEVCGLSINNDSYTFELNCNAIG